MSIEVDNAKYGGCTFTLNGLRIRFRVAKITPKKIGQFVTLWQRVGKSAAPFSLSESVDFFIISVRNENSFGQFVVPKAVLYEKGVLSENGKGGKWEYVFTLHGIKLLVSKLKKPKNGSWSIS